MYFPHSVQEQNGCYQMCSFAVISVMINYKIMTASGHLYELFHKMSKLHSKIILNT